MNRKRSFIISAFLFLALLLSTTESDGQVMKVRFFCNLDRQDSIACKVQTSKNRHSTDPTSRVFSYRVNTGECDNLYIFPEESEVFINPDPVPCSGISEIIYIEVKNPAKYSAYKKAHEKILTTPYKLSTLSQPNQLGQNLGTIEKGISF